MAWSPIQIGNKLFDRIWEWKWEGRTNGKKLGITDFVFSVSFAVGLTAKLQAFSVSSLTFRLIRFVLLFFPYRHDGVSTIKIASTGRKGSLNFDWSWIGAA